MVSDFSKSYACNDVEKRFIKENESLDSNQIRTIKERATKLKSYLIENIAKIFFEIEILSSLKKKNHEISAENIEGKTYSSCLKLIKSIFFSAETSPNPYVLRLGFQKLLTYRELKGFKEKQRCYLKCTLSLGAGGHHEVYLGYDLMKNREVAIRIPFHKKDFWLDEINIHHFFSLNKTAGIIKIRSIFPEENILVLEKADGDLTTLQKELNADQLINITKQILSVVKTIHDNKLVVKDLKPANILYKTVGSDIVIFLSDLECIEDCEVFKNRGTISYLPLEAFNQKWHPDNKKIDCWSLGLTLLFLLKGPSQVFSGKTSLKIYEQIKQMLKEITLDLSLFLKKIESKKNWLLESSNYSKAKKLLLSDPNNCQFTAFLIQIIVEDEDNHKEWRVHYESIFSSLKQEKTTISRIILGLMDLHIHKRWTVDQALEELKASE